MTSTTSPAPPSSSPSPNPTGPAGSWLVPGLLLLVTFAAAAGVVLFVDLTPRVESDFFFASDDPQLQTSREIAERFPSKPQIFLRAAPSGGMEGGVRGEAYAGAVASLTEAVQAVPGVASVQSLTQGPRSPAAAFDSPFWQRLLVGEGEAATNLVISVEETAEQSEAGEVVRGIEEAVAGSELAVEMSGVPFVVEHVRRSLTRDLAVFSGAALAVFALLIAGLFRSLRIVLGTLAACILACAVTLALLAVFGLSIGVLTANLVTIVFVLTLSHTVFLTGNWLREDGGAGARERVRRAVGTTRGASFWCMVTTLLGFLSLLAASAQPLRELGIAGALGTVVAILAAYLLYPPFLRGASSRRPGGSSDAPEAAGTGRLAWGESLAIAAVCLLAATGIGRVSADPGLLSYFEPGSELREGLAAVDRDGGSSPLSLVVTAQDGGRLDTLAAFGRLQQLQDRLEAVPDTGVVLSAVPLVAEARKTSAFAGMMPPQLLLDILEQPGYQGVALSFMNDERTSARFFIRMREEGRERSRAEVIDEMRQAVWEADLQPAAVGGLYELQGKLASLVARSLLTGLAALLAVFTVIGAVVSRSFRATLAMLGSLALVPLFLLGFMGYLRLPVDFISSPAAQIAIAVGVDSMIHLAAAARRRRLSGLPAAEAWAGARKALARPVLTASLVVAVGFGLFALSSFPPTQRFGLAVAVGTAVSALVTLRVLPVWAGGPAKP